MNQTALTTYFHVIPVYVNILALFARETTLLIVNFLFLNANIAVLTMIIRSSFTRMATAIIAIEFIIFLFR
jgi:hypothetical protein